MTLASPAATLLHDRLLDSLSTSADLLLERLVVIKCALTDASPMPPQQEARQVLAAAAKQLHRAAGTPLLLANPAAQALPFLLSAQQSTSCVLVVAQVLGAAFKVVSREHSLEAGAHVDLLRGLQLLPELLPLRLAQWVAAVGGESIGAVVGRVMPLGEAAGRGVEAHSLARVYDHNLAVLLSGGKQQSDFMQPDVRVIPQPGATHDSLVTGFGAVLPVPDVLPGLISCAEFQALWGWRAEVRARLVGELGAACGGAIRLDVDH